MDEKLFAELEASLKEGMEILRNERPAARTHTYPAPDVKAIRQQLQVTQDQFAALIGISLRTLQNWEQGRRTPEGPARVLLLVAQHNPHAVLAAIQSSKSASSAKPAPLPARRSARAGKKVNA